MTSHVQRCRIAPRRRRKAPFDPTPSGPDTQVSPRRGGAVRWSCVMVPRERRKVVVPVAHPPSTARTLYTDPPAACTDRLSRPPSRQTDSRSQARVFRLRTTAQQVAQLSECAQGTWPNARRAPQFSEFSTCGRHCATRIGITPCRRHQHALPRCRRPPQTLAPWQPVCPRRRGRQ